MAQQYTSALIILTFGVMMLTMMLMFVKHGTKLTPAEKAAISIKFIKRFNTGELGVAGVPNLRLIASSSDGSEGPGGGGLRGEELERARAHRMHLHNQMMADYIIQDVLSTLMSVTNKQKAEGGHRSQSRSLSAAVHD